MVTWISNVTVVHGEIRQVIPGRPTVPGCPQGRPSICTLVSRRENLLQIAILTLNLFTTSALSLQKSIERVPRYLPQSFRGTSTAALPFGEKWADECLFGWLMLAARLTRCSLSSAKIQLHAWLSCRAHDQITLSSGLRNTYSLDMPTP